MYIYHQIYDLVKYNDMKNLLAILKDKKESTLLLKVIKKINNNLDNII